MSKPSRGGGAYFAFIKEKREEIKAALSAADPSKTVGNVELTKEAGARWRLLSADEKKAGGARLRKHYNVPVLVLRLATMRKMRAEHKQRKNYGHTALTACPLRVNYLRVLHARLLLFVLFCFV